MKHNFLILLVTILSCCYACNQSETQAKSTEKETPVPANQPDTSIQPNKSTMVKKDSSSNVQLGIASLIGRWQNIADKQEEWEFKDGYLRIYQDGKVVNEEKYGINDKCAEAETPVAEAEKYISTYDGHCYYIVKIDSSNFVLSYVGRGNTLSFTKAK